VEVTIKSADLTARAETDLNFFAGLISPHVSTKPFPMYYVWLWQLLTRFNLSIKKVLRFALGLPRSHAKTTFIKLLVVYLILYKKGKFFLMVCANEKLAQNMLEDIDTMLGSDTVRKLWGNWKMALTKDTQALKRGVFNGEDVILAALGANSSLRGINIAQRRPDVMIMDDIQTRENAMSMAEGSSLYTWMLATLLKARDFQGCIIIYIGNMYTTDCILYKLKMHKRWQSFITGAILADWTPLWPEYFSIEDLLDEYEHDAEAGEAEIWFAEVMNIPIGGALDLIPGGKLPPSPVQAYEEPDASFITIDPAGYRTNSDDTVVMVHNIYLPMHYELRKLTAKVMNPEETIDQTLSDAVEFGCRYIGVEGVAYQQTLQFWMEKKIIELGLEMSIIELKPQGRHKNTRIRAFIKDVLIGNYSLHPDVRAQFMFQALAFKPDRTDNRDDILDDAAYGLDMRAEYHEQMLFAAQRFGNTSAGHKVAHVQSGNSCLDRH